MATIRARKYVVPTFISSLLDSSSLVSRQKLEAHQLGSTCDTIGDEDVLDCYENFASCCIAKSCCLPLISILDLLTFEIYTVIS